MTAYELPNETDGAVVEYYRYGRYGARFLRRFPVFKPAVRLALKPAVAFARRATRA